jgi:hypothetical protein
MTAFESHASKGADTTASVMRLEKIIGDVQVTQSSGKEARVMEKMRLNSGDDVKSSSKSYAFFNLDDNKALKLDEKSEAVINKNNKKLEVELKTGNLLFDVDKALKSDESLEIKTATMTMGIRGTFAQVVKRSESSASITLLDGTLSCVVTDPATGKSRSVQLKAGEHADFYSGEEYSNGCEIITRKISMADLKGYTLSYIKDHPATAARIFKSCGIDLRNLSQRQVDDTLSRDQNGFDAPVNDGRTSPTAEWYSKDH